MNNDNVAAVRNAYAVAERKDLEGWINLFTPDGVFVDNSAGATYRGRTLADPVPYDGRSPGQPAQDEVRVLVQLPRKPLGELKDARAMGAEEQVVLTVSVNGYGKRTSSYEYRTTGRGGKGIVAMNVNNRNGKLVASFPVEDADQIMLVTDKGQLIRCPVEGIRVAGRSTQGVIVFDTAEDEHVVSVEHIGEEENGNGG